MEIKTMTYSDELLASIASLLALVFSQITLSMPDDTVMKWITAISSVVLCFTAIIKLVDLCLDKFPKWSAAIFRRFKKPPAP